MSNNASNRVIDEDMQETNSFAARKSPPTNHNRNLSGGNLEKIEKRVIRPTTAKAGGY